MIKFPWLWALIPALLIPLLYRMLPAASRATGMALRVPFFQDFISDNPQTVRGSHWTRLLVVLAYLLFVAALIRPQYIGEPISIPESQRDMMLAVDISGSMDFRDLKLAGQLVTRLEVVQQIAGEFIEARTGDRIGLIIFGRNAYIQSPLTYDLLTVSQLLGEAVIGLAGKETAIGDAIGLAVKRMREHPGESQVLVLLTDGANTAGEVEPVQAAELAAKEALKIYTIGVGADEMMVNSMFGRRRINPSSDLDEATLRAIAEKTGGQYFRARDTESLKQIYALIDELEPIERDNDVVRPPEELYIYPLAASMVVALLVMFLTWRREPPGMEAA